MSSKRDPQGQVRARVARLLAETRRRERKVAESWQPAHGASLRLQGRREALVEVLALLAEAARAE